MENSSRWIHKYEAGFVANHSDMRKDIRHDIAENFVFEIEKFNWLLIRYEHVSQPGIHLACNGSLINFVTWPVYSIWLFTSCSISIFYYYDFYWKSYSIWFAQNWCCNGESLYCSFDDLSRVKKRNNLPIHVFSGLKQEGSFPTTMENLRRISKELNWLYIIIIISLHAG